MIKFFKNLRRDEAGAAAAEYALILAVIGGGIALAAVTLGTEIARVFDETASVIGGISIV